MSGRKAGDSVGLLPRVMQKRFLDYSLREDAAWRQIEAITENRIKIFCEIDRELNLEDWVYSINSHTGKVVLERHKTMQERELMDVQRELIENGEGEVTE